MATYKVRVINEQGKVESRFAVKANSFKHATKKVEKFWLECSGHYPDTIEVYGENYPIMEVPRFDYELVKFKG